MPSRSEEHIRIKKEVSIQEERIQRPIGIHIELRRGPTKFIIQQVRAGTTGKQEAQGVSRVFKIKFRLLCLVLEKDIANKYILALIEQLVRYR